MVTNIKEVATSLLMSTKIQIVDRYQSDSVGAFTRFWTLHWKTKSADCVAPTAFAFLVTSLSPSFWCYQPRIASGYEICTRQLHSIWSVRARSWEEISIKLCCSQTSALWAVLLCLRYTTYEQSMSERQKAHKPSHSNSCTILLTLYAILLS